MKISLGICKLIPRSTLLNGLPLANSTLSPKMENASSGVHSAVKISGEWYTNYHKSMLCPLPQHKPKERRKRIHTILCWI